MSVSTNRVPTSFTRQTVRSLLIVARDQRDLHEVFQHEYGDSETLTVLLDRRQSERRWALQPVPAERRRSDRRRLPAVAEDLRYQPYVLVRPHFRPPRDWRYAFFACLLGLGMGFGILVVLLGAPVEFLEADVAGAVRRSSISVIDAVGAFVIDLINAFVRRYL